MLNNGEAKARQYISLARPKKPKGLRYRPGGKSQIPSNMPSQKLPFHIAVVGGGIGGLCAALSIHHHCPKDGSVIIDVYEQAPVYKEIGAGLGIGVNAAKLLHRIGVGKDLNNISGHRNGIWISFRRYDNGNEIVTVPVDDQKEIRQSPVHRAEFLELLFRYVKERNAATLHNNKQCIELKVRSSRG